MSFVELLPGFLITVYLLAMLPGQGMAMVLRQSLLGGPRAALWAVAGNSTGLVVWGVLSAAGLSVIFTENEMAFEILKWSGVAFLVYLSVSTAMQLRHPAGKFDLTGTVYSSPWGAFRTGLITNLTNVKAAVFAVAFIPSYAPRELPLFTGIVVMGLVWAVASSTWYMFLVAVVHRAAALVQRPRVRRALTAVSAIGLLALAAGLALG